MKKELCDIVPGTSVSEGSLLDASGVAPISDIRLHLQICTASDVSFFGYAVVY